MALELIGLGDVPNDGKGDKLRVISMKANAAIELLNSLEPRRMTSSEFTGQNPILANGQEGIETNTGLSKLGDGATVWANLPYRAGNSTSEPVSISPAQLRSSLEELQGDERLPSTAVRGIVFQDIASIRAGLAALVGEDRLPASAINGLANQSATAIVTSLQSLTPDNRLDASAIKNLPTSSASVTSVNTKTGVVVLTAADVGAAQAPFTGTAAAIAATNPVLATGRFGLETDTGLIKFGRGGVAWSNIPYLPVTPHNHALANLLQSGASLGQVPIWNGEAWVPGNQTGGGTGLMSDVQIEEAIRRIYKYTGGEASIGYTETGEATNHGAVDPRNATPYDIEIGDPLVDLTAETLRAQRAIGTLTVVANKVTWPWPSVAQDTVSKWHRVAITAGITVNFAALPDYKIGYADRGVLYISNVGSSPAPIAVESLGANASWLDGVTAPTLAAGSTMKLEWELYPTGGAPMIGCNWARVAIPSMLELVGLALHSTQTPPAIPAHAGPAADGTTHVIIGAFKSLGVAQDQAPPVPTDAGWIEIPGTATHSNVSGNRNGLRMAIKYAASANEGWGTINTTAMQQLSCAVFRVRPAPVNPLDLIGGIGIEANNAADTSVPWPGITFNPLAAPSMVVNAAITGAITALANHIKRPDLTQYRMREGSGTPGNTAIGVSDRVTAWPAASTTFGQATHTRMVALQIKVPA